MILLIVFFVYWLPKCIFVDSMEWLFPSVIFRDNSRSKNVALTFDDAPYDSEGKSLKAILDVLDLYNVKATFFVISGLITTENRRLLVQAVRNGHQLANHGNTNSLHYMKYGTDLYNEINDCDWAITEIYRNAGKSKPTTMYYRPGCGAFHQGMINILETSMSTKYLLALGSDYPNDPVIPFPYLNYLYLTFHIDKGSIVILHDRDWTAETLRKLVPWIIDAGLTPVTLTTLIK
jgi:peptidoglycan/xylan/chitin deacetylase (PgdA/CDA1 family)